MKTDYISSIERLDFSMIPKLDYYANHECSGCGRTSEQIAKEERWNDFDFESESKTIDCGLWFCHDDCYNESFGNGR